MLIADLPRITRKATPAVPEATPDVERSNGDIVEWRVPQGCRRLEITKEEQNQPAYDRELEAVPA